MPIYEFCCILCNGKKELMQEYSVPPPTCEGCEEPMFRMISSTTFVLKGDNWEKDGYSSVDNKPKQSKTEGG